MCPFNGVKRLSALTYMPSRTRLCLKPTKPQQKPCRVVPALPPPPSPRTPRPSTHLGRSQESVEVFLSVPFRELAPSLFSRGPWRVGGWAKETFRLGGGGVHHELHNSISGQVCATAMLTGHVGRASRCRPMTAAETGQAMENSPDKAMGCCHALFRWWYGPAVPLACLVAAGFCSPRVGRGGQLCSCGILGSWELFCGSRGRSWKAVSVPRGLSQSGAQHVWNSDS